MSLRPSDFDQYILLSDRIDYAECFLGEAKAISLTFQTNTNPANPINLTGWTFSVSYKDIMANIAGTGTTLSSVGGFTIISPSAQTDTNLAVTVTNAVAGLATLTVPSSITGMPAVDAPIDGTNTLVKLITIQATYASAVPSFNQLDKYMVGVIIRFA